MKLRLSVPAVCAFLFFDAALFILRLLPGCGIPAAALMALLLTAAAAAALRQLRGCRRELLSCCAATAAVLLLLRLPFWRIETSDFTDFLRPWTEQLRTLGGLKGLGAEIGNYNVPYMVLLALFSRLKTPVLYLIKLTSTLADLLLAAVTARIVRRLSGSRERAAVSFAVLLALPTVFLNSAVWGQCDSVYVSLALLGLALSLEDRPGWGMAAFALSFAFKLQAVFLLPVVLLLFFAKKLRWLHLPIFPAVYLLAVSPALLAGRGFGETVLFYLRSAGSVGDGLNYNSPSVFSLFWNVKEPALAARAGIVAAFVLCLLLFILFFLKRGRITERSLCFAALVLVCGIPLLLPHMHDRYFYFCDVLTLAVAALVPTAAPTVLLSQFASLLGYHAYFYLRYLLQMRCGFVALVPVLGAAAYLCVRELASPLPPAPPAETEAPSPPEL